LVASQYVTGAAANSITFSGLDGDTDKIYLLKYYLKIGGPSAVTYSITLKPNNVTTNQTVFSRTTSTSTTTPNATTSTFIVANAGRGSEYYTNVHISVHRGIQRMFAAESAIYANSTNYVSESILYWNETSTNLTSIVLAGSSTGNFDVGSEFHLYKYTV
jgi:hypothetical protein